MTQSVLKAFNRTFFNLNFRVFAVLSSTSLSRSECLRLVEALHVDRTTLRHKFDAATQCQGGLVVPPPFRAVSCFKMLQGNCPRCFQHQI